MGVCQGTIARTAAQEWTGERMFDLPMMCLVLLCAWIAWSRDRKVSVSKWAYSPLMCDGIVCAGDCDYCGNRERAEAFKTLQTDYEVCRNELCLRCGDYKMAHKGACDDCRWRH